MSNNEDHSGIGHMVVLTIHHTNPANLPVLIKKQIFYYIGVAGTTMVINTDAVNANKSTQWGKMQLGYPAQCRFPIKAYVAFPFDYAAAVGINF